MARTLDGRFTKDRSWFARVMRDLRLLTRVVSQAVDYIVKGGRVRRAYRNKEARGEVYWLE